MIEQDSNPGYIDAHAHSWQGDFQRYPLAPGFSMGNVRLPQFNAEQLLQHAQQSGVQRIVLIQISFYGADNSSLLATMASDPDHFSGVAMVDQLNEPARQMATLRQKGIRGIRIVQGEQDAGSWLSSPGMSEIWRAAAELGMAVCPLCQPDAFPALAHMCIRYPDTRVVIDHLGRVGFKRPVNQADIDSLCSLARYPMVMVKVSALYGLGQQQAPYSDMLPVLQRCLDAFGPERLMWGSDSPFQTLDGHHYQDALDFVAKAGLSQGDKDWLLRKTAEQVFFG